MYTLSAQTQLFIEVVVVFQYNYVKQSNAQRDDRIALLPTDADVPKNYQLEYSPELLLLLNIIYLNLVLAQ